MRVRVMDEKLWEWFNCYSPINAIEDSCGLVMFDDNNKPVAGVVFDSWSDNSVQTHIVLTNPFALRHNFIEICGDYIFFERGRKLAYGLVPSDNEKALKLNKHFGFTETARLKDAFKDGVDYVIMEIRREEYIKRYHEAA